jgi:hypothetical protein
MIDERAVCIRLLKQDLQTGVENSDAQETHKPLLQSGHNATAFCVE